MTGEDVDVETDESAEPASDENRTKGGAEEDE